MALYNYGFTQVESVPLTPPELPSLPVAGGTAGEAALTTETPPAKTLLVSEKEKVTAVVELPRFLLAPVTEETVGRVRYLAGAGAVHAAGYSLPLRWRRGRWPVTGSVSASSFGRCFWNSRGHETNTTEDGNIAEGARPPVGGGLLL